MKNKRRKIKDIDNKNLANASQFAKFVAVAFVIMVYLFIFLKIIVLA